MRVGKIPGMLSLLLLTLACSCDDFLLVSELDGPERIALSVEPTIYQMPVNDSLDITVEGGYPAYTLAILEGGGVIDTDTRTFTAPGTPGNVVIRVTDRAGSFVDIRITVIQAVIGDTGVDYTAENVTATGSPVTEGPISGSFAIVNNGASDGNYPIEWRIYASADTTVGGSDFLLTAGVRGALSGGGSTTVLFNCLWPAERGTYYLIALIDASDDEDATNNKTNGPATTVTYPPPADIDYLVDSVTTSDNPVNTNSAVSGSFTYRNRGGAGGEEPVCWTAYLSADGTIDDGDTKVDSGEVAALAAGVTSGVISVDGGLWPADAGIYYLIVGLSARDEDTGWNNSGASDPVSVYAAALDYIITGVTQNYPMVMTGDPLLEHFDLLNASVANGAEDVEWTAYASVDDSFDDGDAALGSGTVARLDAGIGSTGIDLSGSWSVAAGSYYLIVRLTAPDEGISGNNTARSGPFTVSDPPRYSVTAVAPTLPPESMAGTSFSGSFIVSETSGNPGTRMVEYAVYLSQDTEVGNDSVVAQGTLPPFEANGEAHLSFDSPLTVWPDDSGGEYYIILAIDAGDDPDESDDIFVSSRYIIYDKLESGNENDDRGPTTGELSNVDNLGVLNRPDTLVVQGNLDGPGTWDTYRFQLPNDAAPTDILRVQALWETGRNALDLRFWDDFGYESVSDSTLPDEEPGIEETGLPGGTARYYIGIEALEGPARYYLKISLEP